MVSKGIRKLHFLRVVVETGVLQRKILARLTYRYKGAKPLTKIWFQALFVGASVRILGDNIGLFLYNVEIEASAVYIYIERFPVFFRMSSWGCIDQRGIFKLSIEIVNLFHLLIFLNGSIRFKFLLLYIKWPTYYFLYTLQSFT